MKTWFDDPRQIIRKDQVLEFWPSSDQSPEDRLNAASRFIIYATCIVYLTKRDIRVFIFGATMLSVLYVMHKANMVKEKYGGSGTGGGSCQLPTPENPMGNVLITDYTDAPNRLEACYYKSVKPLVKDYLDDRVSYDSGRSRTPHPREQQYAAARQFISTPVTSIPGDQTSFAEWCYGAKNSKMCRDTQTKCDPNSRGVQLEAFSGLDLSGDVRA